MLFLTYLAILSPFIIATTINYISSLMYKDKIRDISKLFIIPSIFFALIFTSSVTNIFLYIALFLAYIGDIILNYKGNKMLIIGGSFFLASNIFFIIANLTRGNISDISLLGLIISIVCSLGLFIVVVLLIEKHLQNQMKVLGPIYLFLNSLVLMSSLILAFNSGRFIVPLGAFMYFTSDSLLLLGRTQTGEKKYSRYLVMPLYAVGILLLSVF